MPICIKCYNTKGIEAKVFFEKNNTRIKSPEEFNNLKTMFSKGGVIADMQNE